jgi:hypothetical protein
MPSIMVLELGTPSSVTTQELLLYSSGAKSIVWLLISRNVCPCPSCPGQMQGPGLGVESSCFWLDKFSGASYRTDNLPCGSFSHERYGLPLGLICGRFGPIFSDHMDRIPVSQEFGSLKLGRGLNSCLCHKSACLQYNPSHLRRKP